MNQPTLLRLDASPRPQGSVSRRLGDAVQARWLATHPGGQVVRRDLVAEPIPHISNATIEGYYTPPEQMTPALREATALSDRLIAELKGADTVLIAAPIYNFGVPSSLKAWIDQVVRLGHTFGYDGQQFTGLVTQPRAVLALAYGTAGYSGPMASHDHLRPYLSQVLAFIGIGAIDVVAAEATTTADGPAQVDAALARLAALFSA